MPEIPIHPDHADEVLADQAKQRVIVEAATNFRKFLLHWKFVDQRSGKVTLMGENLWPGQVGFVRAMDEHQKVYALKARKLGFTQLSTARDGWIARFGPPNARVHLFSRRDDAAQELLRMVKYGLDNLPPWMRLPTSGANAHELRLDGGGGIDERLLKAYPADKDTAVEATCIHAHIDEWARMGDPQRVWQAIQPSLAGSAHIITTGLGPQNYSGIFWGMTMSGDTEFHPFFADAMQRPDRDKAWYERTKKGLSETHFRQEFPMTWEDALFGGGDYVFARADLDACCRGGGPEAAEAGHRYSIGWDIGRHADAAVGIVVDMSTTPHEVVDYVRMREVPYPGIQKAIERHWHEYGGPRCRLLVEKNGPGEAVLENLELPERVVEDAGFTTSKPSKAKIIENLVVGMQNRGVVYSAAHWPALDSEMRGYQLPDDDVIQDSVMAFAIAYSESYGAAPRGRARRVLRW